MSLRVNYSPLMLRKVKRILDHVHAKFGSAGRSGPKEQFCRETVGLSYSYLSRIGRHHQRPSLRVMENLNLELWVKDPETGEEEKLEYDYECDWNPAAPRHRSKSPRSPSSSSE